jgi:hypothetical protein
MNNAPTLNNAPNWQKLAQISLIILGLTFVTLLAWTATNKHERARALAVNIVLAVASVQALTEAKKPNAFLRTPQ